MINNFPHHNSNLNINLECSYCGLEYNKNNKPLVLKCSHNICQTCHSLNKTKVLCLICNSKFEGKEARRFPINFLLLEIIERTQTQTEVKEKEKKPIRKRKKSLKNDSRHSKDSMDLLLDQNQAEVFFCSQCDVLFPNKFHMILFPLHEFKLANLNEPSSRKSSLIIKSKLLMEKYKKYNENFDKLNDQFFDYLNKNFSRNKTLIKQKLEQNDPLDNLVTFGFINKSDKERIQEHKEKFLNNEKIVSLFANSNSFDEVISKLSENKDIKKSKIHKFISSFFYMEEIYDKKLSPEITGEKISQFNKELEDADSERMKTLYKNFSQDVNVEVYNELGLERDINKNIKLPFLITSLNELIIFDTMTENIKRFTSIKKYFPQELNLIESFSHYLNSDYKLYITGGKIGEELVISNCFSINLNNLNNLEVTSYNNMNEPRFNHSSIVLNNKLYILGGEREGKKLKTFERLNLSDNTWLKLQNSPQEFNNKPNLLNFEDEFIYIFDDLSHFSYYEVKCDKWNTCNPSYRGSYNLALKNFTTMVFDSNVLILGGVNVINDETVINSNLYHLKDIGSVIKAKAEFAVSDITSIIDCGFMIDNCYLLEYSEEKRTVKVFHAKDLGLFKWDLLLTK